MKSLAAALLLAAVAVSPARADDGDPTGSVVYAKGTSLWRIAATGRGKAVEVVALPDGAKADTVRAIRIDHGGHVLIVDIAGAWYWSKLDGDSASPLTTIGCGNGPAELALDATCVVCASDKGTASIHKLGTDQHVDHDVPAAGAIVTGAAAARALIYADASGVWSTTAGAAAPDPKAKKPLAAEPPLAHFSVSPDGTRGLGVYKAADEKDAQLLYTFPLDGSGARRKSIRNGVPIEWSWDSAWALVQDGGKACVMRAVGGEYKCWNGYTAVGIADDGAWALLLGSRDGKSPAKPGKHDKAKPAPTSDEEGEDSAAADDTPVPLPKGPFSLYRARRDGAYTDKPVVIVHDVDGPAAWLPASSP